MLDALASEIKKTIQAARKSDPLVQPAKQLETALTLLNTTCKNTTNAMFSGHTASAFACAHPLLEATGDVIMAWMLLWRAVIADKKIGQKLNTKDAGFYQGKIRAARFFMATILPVTLGKLAGITCENNPAADMEAHLF
jgi:hypothetical protein